jgi:hypothetical protein
MRELIIDSNSITFKEVLESGSTIEGYHDSLYHIKVTSDKVQITADGIDAAAITVSLYDYLDVAQIITVTASVTVDNGEPQLVEVTDGTVSFPFTSAEPGDFAIKATAENMRGGEITIKAVL